MFQWVYGHINIHLNDKTGYYDKSISSFHGNIPFINTIQRHQSIILNNCPAIPSNNLFINKNVMLCFLNFSLFPPSTCGSAPKLDKDERSDEESEEEEEEEEEEREKEGEEEEGGEYCWEKRTNALNSKLTMLTHSCVLNNLTSHRASAVERSHKTQ